MPIHPGHFAATTLVSVWSALDRKVAPNNMALRAGMRRYV